MTKEAIMEAVWEPSEEDYELTDEEKVLVNRRWKEMREHPERNLTLHRLKERVHGRTTE